MISTLDFIRQFTFPHECAFEKGHYGDLAYVISENVPDDPGGLTKWGIDLDSHPHVDIENLTQADAEAIYMHEYGAVRWLDALPALGDFPAPAALVFFDCREVCGLSTAWLCAQRALGIDADAEPGNQTRTAIKAAPGLTLAMAMIDERIGYHRRVASMRPALGKFLDGWIARCNDLKSFQYFPVT